MLPNASGWAARSDHEGGRRGEEHDDDEGHRHARSAAAVRSKHARQQREGGVEADELQRPEDAEEARRVGRRAEKQRKRNRRRGQKVDDAVAAGQRPFRAGRRAVEARARSWTAKSGRDEPGRQASASPCVRSARPGSVPARNAASPDDRQQPLPAGHCMAQTSGRSATRRLRRPAFCEDGNVLPGHARHRRGRRRGAHYAARSPRVVTRIPLA